MSDWDVVGTAPAQLQDPWAVRSLKQAPAKTPIADAVGNVLSHTPPGQMVGAAENAIAGAAPQLGSLLDTLTGAAPGTHKVTYQPQTPSGKEQQAGLGEAANLATQGGAQQVGLPSPEAGSAALSAAGQFLAPVAQKFGIDPEALAQTLKERIPQAINSVGAVTGIGGAAEGLAGGLAARSADQAALDATNGGFRSAEGHGIAQGIAGQSGKEALTLHNQQIGNTYGNAEAGVPHGTPLNYDTLEAAREGPNAVHARLATALPEAPLSPAAAQQVQSAGVDDLVTHTPDAQAIIDAQKQRLLAGPLNGQQVVNNMRALRQEGHARTGSEDVEQQNIGRAQLAMSRALEQHVADTLPANADVSMEQLQAARTALAKNYAVQGALKGSDVDMAAIARMQRADPDLLTGGLKTIADFTNANPAVTGLGSRLYEPPSYLKDIMGVPGTHHVQNFLSPSFWTGVGGGQAAARRLLTGNTAEAVQGVREATPGALGNQFAPIDRTPQAPAGMTASAPTAPPPAAAGPPGQIPFADVLSHGVEQNSAPSLSAGPMGTPAPQGIPFNVNAAHQAGGLSLGDELGGPFRGTPMNMSDFPGVKSQGVPEGIVQKFPNRGGSDQGSIGAVSPESINRGSRDLAVIDPDGNEQTLLKGATQIDDLNKTPKNSIVIDRSTGEIVHRPASMSQNIANGLRNRWATMGRQLGDNFVMGTR